MALVHQSQFDLNVHYFVVRRKTVKVNLQLSAIKSGKLGNCMGSTIFALQLSFKRHILSFGLLFPSHNNSTGEPDRKQQISLCNS